jgi:serine phosphatase RsbU (regulator of sigma subunit)
MTAGRRSLGPVRASRRPESRIVKAGARNKEAVELQTPRNGENGLPRRREPDLADLATFTLDDQGRITSWSVTATKLFGHPASAVTGRDVCDVLLTGPGQRDLVSRALAEVAAGQVHAATVAGGSLGEGRFAIRWEPLNGLGGGAVVIVQRAWPQPMPSWLREAAARIGDSLDLAETAAEVAEAAVPTFADFVMIYAAERLLAADELTPSRASHGSAVRRLAGRKAGQSAEVAAKLSRPGDVLVLGPGTPGSRAMATGAPILFDRLDGETAQRLARQPDAKKITTDYTSYMAMPLIARGAVVGCAIFAREQASPPFNQSDISLAGELASRAAVCLDNARLYDRERRTAQALQLGLLPGRAQIPDGLEVAHRYRPVRDNVIGGDWHDIVSLPEGRAALIVGDAMGHGPEAAAIMVQLRTAAHTLAGLDLAPEQVLRRLDAMAAGLATAPFAATCVYAVIDPQAGSCAIAQAGHQAPILVQPGGATQVLDLPPGLPLGLGEEGFEANHVDLPPGSVLALYTDGLVESRTRTLDAGLAALRRSLSTALAEPSAPLRQASLAVTQIMREHSEDDMTLVLARIRPVT